MNLTTLMDSIYDCFSAFLPAWPFVWSEQNAPRPDSKYITLRLSPVSKIGQDDMGGSTNSAGVIEVVGNREFTLSLQAIGSGAMQALVDIDSALERFTFLETLRAKGLVYVRSEPIQDLTYLYDTQYTERGNLDITLRIADSHTDTVGYFDKVEGEGELETAGGRVFTVPINT